MDIEDRPTKIINEETLPIHTGDFTPEELETSIKSMSNNKAPGLDEIPAEVWKTGILNRPLLDVCNKMLKGEKPSIWTKSIIIPLPKKGDLSVPPNYRGISLTPIAAKIYNKMLLNRIRPHIEPMLRKNQNGFRPNRSTTAQILALRRLVEGIKMKNLPAVLTFVDFKKAFDSIHRGKMLEILKAYGIPETIVSAIGMMYRDTEAQVISPDGETEFFSILAGVLQGDTLAPLLFIIVLDYVLRTAIDNDDLGFTLKERRSSRHPAVKVTDTDFADDIALLSNYIGHLRQMEALVEPVRTLLSLGNGSKFSSIHVFIKVFQSFSEAIYIRRFIETTGKGVPCFRAPLYRKVPWYFEL